MNYRTIHQWLLDLCEKSQERGNADFTNEVLNVISLLDQDWENYNQMKQDRHNDQQTIEALQQTMSEEGYNIEIKHKILSKPVFKHD